MIGSVVLTVATFLTGDWLPDLWYAAWLVVVISLAWSATRYEKMSSILRYSVSCAVRMVIVLLAGIILLMLMDWMTK